MNNPQQLIIYLDIFAFVILIVFFGILFKSKILFKSNKKEKVI